MIWFVVLQLPATAGILTSISFSNVTLWQLCLYPVFMNPLAVRLNRLELPNPILVASGTFGYAKEMTAFVDFAALGGIVPKTVTPQPRVGNPPPRTVETTGGMLNSIGLDNDGFDQFVDEKLP
jgi:dihydroorotate dehydrogenase (NAD+) catalytic subunit